MRRLAIASLVALALAGCGGDGRLSEDEYRSAATTICLQSRQQQERIEQPTRATPEAIANYFRRQVEITERNVKRFDALKPPEAFEERHDRLVSLGREGIRQIDSLVKSFEGGDDPHEALVSAQKDLVRIGDEQRRVARDLGVRECTGTDSG